MPIPSAEVEKIVQNALAMHEEIMLGTRDVVPEDSLGFVYGKEAGETSLRRIIERIPIERDVMDQATYLIRAFICSQIFNEGNKRMATVFTEFWLLRSNLRLEAEPAELERFLLTGVAQCPKIPLPPDLLSTEDGLYRFIRQWLEKRVVKVN